MSDDKTTQDEHDRTDDVEAHALKSGREPAEAADVEAHAFRSGREPAEAADVEAHRRKFRGSDEVGPPPEGTEREQPGDADDDVEGHRRHFVR